MNHWISRHILRQLLSQREAKWSELRPEGEVDNLFGYYTKRLVAAGLIENVDKTWRLTDRGAAYLSDVSLDTMKETKSPKLCVMIAGKSEGLHAVYRWSRAPYSGKYMVPYGRWHRGDGYQYAVEAEVVEKYGTEIDWPQFAILQTASIDEDSIHEVQVITMVSLADIVPHSTPNWATDDHRRLADKLYGTIPA